VSPDLRARLAGYRIQLLSEAREFSILARENCFALVHHGESGMRGIGSSGMMTGNGLAWLVWRDGQPHLVGKGTDVPALPAEVEAIRRFSQDLKAVLA